MTSSLHIIGSKHSGGAERFFARLVTALNERGHAIHAVTPPRSMVKPLLSADVPWSPVAMRGVWDLQSRYAIRKLARALRPDIVQTYMGRATRLTRLQPGRSPVHVARLGGYYDLKGYRHAHAWIGNTRGICDYLIGNGLPAERVFHIGNFVDAPAPVNPLQVDTLRRSLDMAPDALCLLAVGRLHPNKGYPDLLEAVAGLPRIIAGRPVHLVIVGGGPLDAELRNRAATLAITGHTHFAGWQTDIGPYYELADVFVCPSRHEPLGNVILEAWSHGRAVVSTNAAGPSELISPGDDGLLVPCADPAALRDALTRLLDDDALRARLGEAGRRKLRERHSREAVVDAYLGLYETLRLTA
jgi:glycosyltransferase involved in cell wall biosynthesis